MKETHVFAEVIEDLAKEQFEEAMSQPFAVKGVLLPDVHAGYSLPIGSVVATKDVVVPAWVGFDIGCGCCAVPTTFRREDVEANAQEIFKLIHKYIPVGFAHNQKDSVWHYAEIPMTEIMNEIWSKNGLKQLCSLGGNNHFCEIGYDETDRVWITVHSGSRGIGHAVASHYMKLASGSDKAKEGHFGFDVNSDEGKAYIADMNFCLAFALENRLQIVQRTAYAMNKAIDMSTYLVDTTSLINRNHNHAELKDGLWIHRKGATHAEAGMMGVIPGNMRDGSFVVEGKGNPDSLYSSSHGAGRVMGRKAAQRALNVEDFAQQMTGIVANVGIDTLDESPNAYKSIFEVMDLQKDLVKVVHHIKPLINCKG